MSEERQRDERKKQLPSLSSLPPPPPPLLPFVGRVSSRGRVPCFFINSSLKLEEKLLTSRRRFIN